MPNDFLQSHMLSQSTLIAKNENGELLRNTNKRWSVKERERENRGTLYEHTTHYLTRSLERENEPMHYTSNRVSAVRNTKKKSFGVFEKIQPFHNKRLHFIKRSYKNKLNDVVVICSFRHNAVRTFLILIFT